MSYSLIFLYNVLSLIPRSVDASLRRPLCFLSAFKISSFSLSMMFSDSSTSYNPCCSLSIITGCWFEWAIWLEGWCMIGPTAYIHWAFPLQSSPHFTKVSPRNTLSSWGMILKILPSTAIAWVWPFWSTCCWCLCYLESAMPPEPRSLSCDSLWS